MTFDDVERLWRSPHNAPSPAQLEAQRAELVRRLRRRHRGFVIGVSAALAGLVLLGVRFALYLARGGAFDGRQEWASVALLLLPVLGAAVFVRQYLRHRARHRDHHRSISASLRALLDENRLARRRVQGIAVLNGIFVLVFPVIAWQLQAVGKARPGELMSMVVLFAGLMVLVGLCLAYEYWRRLQPRRRELEAMLRFYQSEP